MREYIDTIRVSDTPEVQPGMMSAAYFARKFKEWEERRGFASTGNWQAQTKESIRRKAVRKAAAKIRKAKARKKKRP